MRCCSAVCFLSILFTGIGRLTWGILAADASATEIVPDVSTSAAEGVQYYDGPINAQIQVWVTSSKQAEEVSKLGVTVKFTSYMIRCQTSLSSYSFDDRTVWRRFKDFDVSIHLLQLKLETVKHCSFLIGEYCELSGSSD